MTDTTTNIRIRLSDLIGQTVALQPLGGVYAGRGFKACCPFHEEKAASLTVRDDLGRFECLSCGAAGNAFTWLRMTLGCGADQAIEKLERLERSADLAALPDAVLLAEVASRGLLGFASDKEGAQNAKSGS